jgi:DNA-binding transcriptional ArsR family regulator
MKRNMDLARLILFEIEKRSWEETLRPLSIDGYSDEDVSYQIKLLKEAGLIKARDFSSGSTLRYVPGSLTWLGHDFLDAARQESRWKQAMSLVREKAGSVTFEIVKEVLVAIARRQVGL